MKKQRIRKITSRDITKEQFLELLSRTIYKKPLQSINKSSEPNKEVSKVDAGVKENG